MSVSIAEIMELDCLAGAVVLAGAAGLNRVVRWVNIQEVLDCLETLRQGELLITTGFGLQDDLILQQNLIQTLAGRELSGLAVQTGFYLHSIPPVMRTQAEELAFPLIELPREASFRTLTEGILRRVMQQQRSLSDQESFLNDLLAGRLSPEAARCRASSLGYEPEGLHLVLQLGWDEQAPEHPLLEKVTRYFAGFPRFHYLAKVDETGLTVLLSTPQEDLRAVCSSLFASLQTEESPMCCGASAPALTLAEIPLRFEEASQALRLARYLGQHESVAFFPDQGIYRLFFALKGTPGLKAFYQETVASLVAYDHSHASELVQTLKTYFSCNQNTLQTAATLYIHRHTLSYRLKRIAQLTGLNPALPADSLKLQLGLLVMDFLR